MAISEVRPPTSAAIRKERMNSSAVWESSPRVELSHAAICGPIERSIWSHGSGTFSYTCQCHLCNADALSLAATDTTDEVIPNLCVPSMGCARDRLDKDIYQTRNLHRPKMFIMTDEMCLTQSALGTSNILFEGVRQAAANSSVSPTVK